VFCAASTSFVSVIWQHLGVQRRQKLFLTCLFAGGIGLFVIAGLIGNSGNNDRSVSDNPAIDRLIPNRGDEVLQQQVVGIDLAAGYQLVSLTISPDAACRFPVDVTAATRYVEGLQQYLFTPGQGQPIEALAADANCVVAVYQEIAQPQNTGEIDWSFTGS